MKDLPTHRTPDVTFHNPNDTEETIRMLVKLCADVLYISTINEKNPYNMSDNCTEYPP